MNEANEWTLGITRHTGTKVQYIYIFEYLIRFSKNIEVGEIFGPLSQCAQPY